MLNAFGLGSEMTSADLIAWRLAHTLVQAEMAALLNRSLRQYSRWETGAAPIPDWLPMVLDDLVKLKEGTP